jgi:hypothetical protein
MSISRRALLISNAGEIGAENYCKGVFRDIANYTRLFTSPQGGWWQTSEIVILDRPTVSQVKREMDTLTGYDYSFIGFAGHGWYSKPDAAEVLVLRKGEELSSLELRKSGGKRTIILDCCREIHNESALSPEERSRMLLSKSAAARRVPNPQLCRDKFDLDVSKSSRSLVVMHSSTPPEKSGDDERLGGYYTFGVHSTADAWAEKQSEDGWKSSADALSVVGAHEGAAASTRRRSGDRQNPTIEKPRGDTTYFPYVVFA